MSNKSPLNPKYKNSPSPIPKSGRLGRGLAALIGSGSPINNSQNASNLQESSARSEESQEIKNSFGKPSQLALDNVKPSKDNPRNKFNSTELDDLANSIKQQGIIQPIVVRPFRDGKYEIVAGERRWRAAKKAGLKNIPAWINEIDDATALEIALIENIQRADLNSIDEAKGYQQLIKQYGYSQKEISQALGRSKSHITNTIRLLQLPDEIQDYVISNKLSSGHARAIITLPEPIKIAKQIIQDGLSVRQTEELAKNISLAGTVTTQNEIADGTNVIEVRSHHRLRNISDEVKSQEAKLVASMARNIGTSISLTRKGTKRILQIEVNNEKELSRICNLFEAQKQFSSKSAS